MAGAIRPIADLKSKRSILGGADFEALYQGRPTAEEGANIPTRVVAPAYIEIPNLKRIIQSWDTAFKTGSENDYSVCTTWRLKLWTASMLLHRFKKRIEFPEYKEAPGGCAGYGVEAEHHPHRGRKASEPVAYPGN